MKPSELLDTPEKWCKGKFAKNAKGEAANSWEKDAVAWCIVGALNCCRGSPCSNGEIERLSSLIFSKYHFASIGEFNDDPLTKYEDVIAVLKEVGL